MRPRTWLRAGAAALLIAPLCAVTAASGAAADDGHSLTLKEKLTPTSTVSADKADTSRLAQTDRSLLGRKDSTPVPVMIKLDYDSVATYDGGINGLAATSPSVTGRSLRGSSTERAYEAYIGGREKHFRTDLKSAVPSAKLGRSLKLVYGGLAAVVPANQIDKLVSMPGVVAVQKDSLRHPLTDASTQFIGADSLDSALGGAPNAGKGVIFGSLDSGVWPEHPSFADNGNLSAPPAKADGTPRTCDFGPDPLTNQPFTCNNKLIGGAGFLSTYNAVVGGEVYGDTARDSDGHGTHTASTAAGDVVASAKVFGVERGPIRGVAPGAWISVYKVCGKDGCFSSDSAAAVQQAILDGVNVINFSISGGSNPYTDPVELAFLDAYAAGVFVAASAGNSGPGAGTTDHVSPWVTTVAASTQTREFSSTITFQSGADTLQVEGASIMGGVADQTPVVIAGDAPYNDALCQKTDPAPDLYAGKIVVCKRGSNARVDKGYNVLQGGAVGMILYNPTLADVETDNHWLPAVHVADGTAMMAWLGSHSDVTAAFTPGVKKDGQGDVMASFSSRGPGGLGIKPDITAPGVQILAGQTPTPDSTTSGPAGQYYQAIAGTSMSSPHIAGSAILEKALHPSWTPGQIKSALMTTAKTSVVKEDGTTPTDPFDDGSGRVDLTQADNPGLTFDETAANMAVLGADKVHAIDLNLPSIDAPVMPGTVTTYRTAVNVTNRTQEYRVSTTAPKDSSISVWPREFEVRPGRSVTLRITISSTAPTAQYFGEVRLSPKGRSGLPQLHLPVAFVPQQADVNLTSTCDADTLVHHATATCTITTTNNSPSDAVVSTASRVSNKLRIVSVSGATRHGDTVTAPTVTLGGSHPGVPTTAAGSSPAGFLPLQLFGATPDAIGDEDIVNYDVPEFVFNGRTYTSVGVDSNGYLVAGGGTSTDNDCCSNVVIGDPATPNNVMAPFWTDLDGTHSDGIRATVLTDGVDSWIAIQWDVNVWGTTDTRTFQVWIGVNGTQDVSFTYSGAQADPNGQAWAVGAENSEGAGVGYASLPDGSDLGVTSTPPTPGGSQTYTVTVRGQGRGTGRITSWMNSPNVSGTTIVSSDIRVR
ncbi:MAG: S8 family serine peptidase [Frankiales bacterium]|nr:S8 family serine peptidase [Frankiales bacterium]